MVTAFGPTQQEREALLEGARRIAPQIRDAADEIEAGRQLPDHVVQLLREAGAFRMIQPKAWGGHDADPVTQILFIEEIAKADASAAWCVMIGCDGGLLSRELDEHVAREMYADIDAVTCGAAFPPGKAVPVEGGYRATGRWPYLSGITHAAWAQLIFKVVEEATGAGEAPPSYVRLVVPRHEVTVLDTWRTTGMRGSGSYDIEVNDLFVPNERCIPRRASGGPPVDDPLRHPAWLLPKHMGVPLGVARAAHDEVLALTQDRVAVRGVLRDDPLTQATLGETEARIGAARAYALSAADRAWHEVCATGDMSDRNRAGLRLAITYTHQECLAVVEQLYAIAGSAALYTERSTLDRRLRDMHAMNQHVVIGVANYAVAGRVLLGLGAGAPFW